MAVPAELMTLDISGKYSMNKTLTDMAQMDNVLRLQGVGWLTRKAISLATIYLDIKHYKDKDDVERIDAEQTASGIHPTREERTLTWTEYNRYDDLFGYVVGKSRRVKKDQLDLPYLREGWTEDTYEHGLIQAWAKSDTSKSHRTWVANQVWGIQEIDGERRYVRRLDFLGPGDEEILTTFVYDYLGKL